jgi:hypothetical protein
MGLQAAARHLAAADASDVSPAPLCCVIAESAILAGHAALGQIVSGAVSRPADDSIADEVHSRQRNVCVVTFTEHGPSAACKPVADRVHCAPCPLPSAGDKLHFQKHIEQALHNVASAGTDGAPQQPPVLVIDCLDLAIAYCGIRQVTAALNAVIHARAASGVAALLHAHLHPASIVASVQQLATCCVALKGVSTLQADVIKSACGRTVHVEALATTLRHSGTCPRHAFMAAPRSAPPYSRSLVEAIPVRCVHVSPGIKVHHLSVMLE